MIENLYWDQEDLVSRRDCKEYLQGILEAVYQTGDTEQLDHCLDELCYLLQCKMPEGKPVLEYPAINQALDYLTFTSWMAQIELHGATKEELRAHFPNWARFEKEYETKRRRIV